MRTSLVCLVLLVVGCRSLRDRESDFSRVLNEPAPVSEAVRVGFGVVGVTIGGNESSLVLERPHSFSTVFSSVTAHSFNKLNGLSSEDDADLGDEAQRVLFISAVSLAAGILEGVFDSVPASELRTGQHALNEALKTAPLEAGIEKQLLDQAAGRRITNLRLIPADLPEQLRLPEATNSNLQILHGWGFDSVLVLKLGQYGFEAHGGGNPPLAFVFLLEVDVVRASDGQVLHTGPLIYRSSQHHFNRWVAGNARLFRAELENAQRLCAEVLLDQLFKKTSPAAGRAATK